MSVKKKVCGWPVSYINGSTDKCGRDVGHVGRCIALSVNLCPDCDMLLPHGSPGGRCDRCHFKLMRGDQTDEPRLPFDQVHQPKHYNQGGIECIDAIEAALGQLNFEAYCRGAAMKYIWRAPHKGKHNEDLAKAVFYLRMAQGDDPRE
jgi:hypothetical protein